ncbi:hypothetical protein [Pedobacter nyackensis]|uniref:Uncharacterized protein n=1 Tax=Pedobacter nyackensis TaxID=475255 RepID=A0A1W2DWV5_9SPHI|nr:hypothetical protein [Pedobacter nyackensis]SMD01368.1 hypothetical protein SAMN04488101_108169 [Pedobacter nyackensis]
MLKAFSWQDFLLAATILTLIWYLLVWILFYRKSEPLSPIPLPHAWEEEFDQLDEQDNLMGKPAMEHGVSIVQAEDFSFAERELRDEYPDQLEDPPELREEIKTICKIIASEDGTKEDFFSLFEMLKDKYPEIASSSALADLNEFISEHVPFQLSDQELENIWS